MRSKTRARRHALDGRLLGALVVCSLVSTAGAAGQSTDCRPGEPEVRRLTFIGNSAIPDAELAKRIETTQSGWARRAINLGLSPKRCLNRDELAIDLRRLKAFYQFRGFLFAAVDTAVTEVDRGVHVRFTITEGPPTIVQSIDVTGMPEGMSPQSVLARFSMRPGMRYDRDTLREAAAFIVAQLKNSGYPYARDTVERTLSADRLQAVVKIPVTPGPRMKVDSIEITVREAPDSTRRISDRIVRRLIGIDTGGYFNLQQIAGAQERLYQTEGYQQVDIEFRPSEPSQSDSGLTLIFRLTENLMRFARVGWGYGTLDCFRANADYADNNFLHIAQRMSLNTRVSKVGIGEPLDVARNLCAQALDDPYSTKLNYYAGFTLRQPSLPGLRALPTLTLYSARTSEFKAYLRTVSVGGVASVELRRYRRLPITFTYQVDFGRTESQPALFCAVFNRCTQEERQRLETTQRLGVLGIATSRDNSNSQVAPTRGSVWRAELRHASRATLADSGLGFNRILLDGARYMGIGSHVLALRLNAGAVFNPSFGPPTSFIPPNERLFAGGPKSMRGFPQNELGSAVYIAAGFDTVVVAGDTLFRVSDTTRSYRRAVPVGGNSLVVASVELRLRTPLLSNALNVTLFTDIGDVWNRGQTKVFQDINLKATPGVQVGVQTPVGLVRTVIGYNPYSRPAGPLYFEATTSGGALPCVTPGNTIPVHNQGTPTAPVLVQSEGLCDAGFRPADSRSFRGRLTFSLAIGQAF